MIDNGGLLPVATGARVTVADKKLSVIDGPFVEAKEVVGGYAVFELRDKDEAVAMAKEFMQLHLEHMPEWEGACEVRALGGQVPKKTRSAAMTAADIHRAVLAVWRVEQPRLITSL